MKTLATGEASLTDAVAELIEGLHQRFPGVITKKIPQIEDEDFAIEVAVPSSYSLEEAESWSHKECIRLEDKYDVYILPLVIKKH